MRSDETPRRVLLGGPVDGAGRKPPAEESRRRHQAAAIVEVSPNAAGDAASILRV